MGFMAKIKALFAGPAIKGMVGKLTALCEEEVVKRATERIKADAEDEAKEQLADIVAEVAKEKLREIPDPTGITAALGDVIVEQATPPITDKVWDRVKDKIVKKKGADGQAAAAAPAKEKPSAPAGYGK